MLRKLVSLFSMVFLCLTLTQGIYASEKDPYVYDDAYAYDLPFAEENELLAGASSAQSYQFTAMYGQSEARSMLSEVNSFRTGSDAWYWDEDNETKVECPDLEELSYDYELEKVAMLRAAEIVASFGHTRPNGEQWDSAYDELGYSCTAAGENLAVGYGNAHAACAGWREDNKDYDGQGHRRNMLSGDFNRIGIAHIIFSGSHYWVQELAYSDEPVSEVEALDGSTTVSYCIADEMIEGLTLSSTPPSVNIREKETYPLPTVSLVIRVKDRWSHGSPVRPNIEYTWSVNNSAYATISDNSLIGVAAGRTSITTTVYGRVLNVPVTVNHVPVTVPAVEATCAATGLTEGRRCSACGLVLTEQRIVSKKAHTVAIDSAVEATCISTGLTEGSHCSVCKTVLTAQQEVPKKDHTVVTDPAVEASCTEPGLTEGSHCSECHTVFTAQQEVSPLGHSWGEWTVTKEATYESPGIKQRVCSRNPSHVETEEIPKLTRSGFSDVQDPHHAYYNAIYWAADAGITKGYPDGTFGIDRPCTRGEMIMFLWRYIGKPAPKTVSKSPFKDVEKTHAFYKAILWASQKGITKGYSDGTFGINRNVSRGECMMFLWRLKGKPAPKTVSKSPFKDVPKNHVFYNAILWGYQKKITTGYTSGEKKGTFGIDENCTRGQIVTFLYRAK